MSATPPTVTAKPCVSYDPMQPPEHLFRPWSRQDQHRCSVHPDTYYDVAAQLLAHTGSVHTAFEQRIPHPAVVVRPARPVTVHSFIDNRDDYADYPADSEVTPPHQAIQVAPARRLCGARPTSRSSEPRDPGCNGIYRYLTTFADHERASHLQVPPAVAVHDRGFGFVGVG
jgi:hypothetical protein